MSTLHRLGLPSLCLVFVLSASSCGFPENQTSHAQGQENPQRDDLIIPFQPTLKKCRELDNEPGMGARILMDRLIVRESAHGYVAASFVYKPQPREHYELLAQELAGRGFKPIRFITINMSDNARRDFLDDAFADDDDNLIVPFNNRIKSGVRLIDLDCDQLFLYKPGTQLQASAFIYKIPLFSWISRGGEIPARVHPPEWLRKPAFQRAP